MHDLINPCPGRIINIIGKIFNEINNKSTPNELKGSV